MLTKRVQLLFDDDRYERVRREASRRNVSFAAVVREAVDAALPPRWPERAGAADVILNADPMPVPADVAALKDELRAARSHGR